MTTAVITDIRANVKSKNCLVENVKVKEFNGDSFSWQTTEYVTLRDCEAANGSGLGFHPGTGSDHSVVEGCILFRDETEQNSGHRNSFTNNVVEDNGIKQGSAGFFIGGRRGLGRGRRPDRVHEKETGFHPLRVISLPVSSGEPIRGNSANRRKIRFSLGGHPRLQFPSG